MVILCGLTLELSGRRRYAARARAEKMYGVPQPGPWWHAVGAPLERLVRPHPRVHRATRLCSASCPPPRLPAPRCRRWRGGISSRRAAALAEEANAGPGGPMNWLTIIGAYAVRCSDLVRWLQVIVFALRGIVVPAATCPLLTLSPVLPSTRLGLTVLCVGAARAGFLSRFQFTPTRANSTGAPHGRFCEA